MSFEAFKCILIFINVAFKNAGPGQQLYTLQAHERRQTPAERELHSQMRVFARYQSPAEHEELLDGLLLEQRIRTRLEVSHSTKLASQAYSLAFIKVLGDTSYTI